MLAGTRTEPAVSLPSATIAEPSHRLTPAPAEEPPGTRCALASHGLRGVPQCGLTPRPPKASSTVWDFPITTPSWRRSVETTGPSLSHLGGNRFAVPAKVGQPLTP